MDLPRALVTRQLTQIRLFDFDVCYILGAKHKVANRLSQRPRVGEDKETNINNFITTKLNYLQIYFITIVSSLGSKQENSTKSDKYKALRGEYQSEKSR